MAKSKTEPVLGRVTHAQKSAPQKKGARKTGLKKPLKEMAQTHTNLALETLAEVAARGNDEKTRLAAAEALLDRAWGKPHAQAADVRADKAALPVLVKVDTGIRRDVPQDGAPQDGGSSLEPPKRKRGRPPKVRVKSEAMTS